MARFRLGFDIGGTFTDFVLIEADSGLIYSHKLSTTVHNPEVAVRAGWQALLAQAGIAGAEVTNAIHGTTLITNCLVERTGAVTLLIATQGFSDVLDMQREMRYDIYDLHAPQVEHLVPRPLRFEVQERLDAFGDVVEELDLDSLEQVVQRLERAGVIDSVEAAALCFLHAFTNPAHECKAGAWLAQRLPHLQISLSHEVAPEIREYERMSTTVCNAYVQPLAETYLRHIQEALQEVGFNQELFLMLSSGGVSTLDTAVKFPIRLVESGPAAGALAAVFYGALLHQPDLVSFDMGGTTAKMCLIKDGQPAMSDDFEIARVHRFKRGSGLPVRVPTIELIEIGAGGGSIARVDELGLLKVGPESAGADPGPACYGLGGDQPTVTDADLLLGYLNPDFFLGGRMTLEPAAAEAAIARLAATMHLSPVDTAHGIYQVVNENMISATRVHVAERGADPRRLRLMAFGGAGPVHAYEIARALKMRGFICPASAGVTSALGFLTAPSAFEFARTHIARLASAHLAELDHIYAELAEEGRTVLRSAGVDDADMVFTRKADLRHVGQGHEIVISLPWDHLADISLEEELRPHFFAQYEAIYGHAHTHLDLEITTCRLNAAGPRPHVTLPEVAPGPDPTAACKQYRRVYFTEVRAHVDTPIYDRYALGRDCTIPGPAIVEERESTAVIGPSGVATIDRYANLVVSFPNTKAQAGP